MRFLRHIFLVLCIALWAGCDRAPDATVAALPTEIAGEGVVRGRVMFSGMPPVMAELEVPCHPEAGPIVEETVVVNDNGTLRNVLVYVKGAPAADGSGAEAAVLDQMDCRFSPRVVGVQIRQGLRIRSSDATVHNVQYQPRHNRRTNFVLMTAGAERTVSFEHHEIFRAKCDVHPWMMAYIGVFENPYFAATGEEGSFEIGGIPDGEYTLVAWHEKYGVLEQPLLVAGSEAVEMEFVYRER